MYKEITRCRICGNSELIPILHLGNQYLTGVFPKTKSEYITCGPLELLKCQEDKEGKHCGLVQLRQSYDLNEMYGQNYGYRSGLNQSMVNHLHQLVKKILDYVSLGPEDIIVDIGSNDATLLKAYPMLGEILVGMDPTGVKFREYYPDYVQLIPDFFSREFFQMKFGNRKAKVITSIAMFYDIEEPLNFMQQIRDILHDEGVWVFEQSYMPAMLEATAYDTICHEHLEYYRLKQIKWMTDRVGLKIIDVEFNTVNGGSFAVMAAKDTAPFPSQENILEKVLQGEEKKGLHTLKPYRDFGLRVYQHRDELRDFIKRVRSDLKLLIGYGASTKGNVILQLCNFSESDIPFVAEVNKDKFGCFTPGTGIPIISEAEAKALKPDYLMILPWHFRDNILTREKKFLESGGRLLFPLPKIETVELILK